MTPSTGTAILVLGVFVLPGFVTSLLRERLFVVRRDQDAFSRLLLALFYSALVYAVVFIVAVAAGADRDDVVTAYQGDASVLVSLVLAVSVVIVIPLVLAVTGATWHRSGVRVRLLRKVGLSEAHGTRSGWDAMFSRKGSAMIRIRLKDGRVVGGWYGGSSLAAYSDHGGDVFVSERWEFDDDNWFQQPATDSLGIWVAGDQIAIVEMYAEVPPTPGRVDEAELNPEPMYPGTDTEGQPPAMTN